MTMNHVPEAPQSASGDYAWLGAEPGSVADQLYMSAADEWNQAINSRFVNELGQFTRNYTQTIKRGLLTTNKG